ncbi:hypothetical protein RJ55_07307 [Drechmeria coniospora]|nr:hypothetical protein RJ55_07307 [Drechmeria coniospora]
MHGARGPQRAPARLRALAPSLINRAATLHPRGMPGITRGFPTTTVKSNIHTWCLRCDSDAVAFMPKRVPSVHGTCTQVPVQE